MIRDTVNQCDSEHQEHGPAKSVPARRSSEEKSACSHGRQHSGSSRSPQESSGLARSELAITLWMFALIVRAAFICAGVRRHVRRALQGSTSAARDRRARPGGDSVIA